MQGQIATGERAGQRVRRRLLDPEEGDRSGAGYGQTHIIAATDPRKNTLMATIYDITPCLWFDDRAK